MTFTVIYDANVLYPAPLRDLLMRIGMADLIRARWTDVILDECFRNIIKRRPELNKARLSRTRQLMNCTIRDVLVTGYEPLIEGLKLPDVDDRHVLAAAIRAGAQVIVTFNLKDFPASALEPLGIEAEHPDSFISNLIDLAPGTIAAIVTEQARSLKNPPRSLSDLLDTLLQQGLAQSVAKLRGLFGLTL